MALRIAFDLDGVLADLDAALLREAKRLFSPPRPVAREPVTASAAAPAPPDKAEDASPHDPDERPADGTPEDQLPEIPSRSTLQLSVRQQRRLWRHVGTIDGFWESLQEIEPGAVAALARLASARDWEIIFLTSRPATAGATAQVQSQRWLAARGFTFPSVCVVQGSRGRIAAALDLDAVIDDRPENCLDVLGDSHARAVLVWRGDGEALPASVERLGVGVVRSVADCLTLLTEMEAPATGGGRMVGRVKRLLGWKQPAST